MMPISRSVSQEKNRARLRRADFELSAGELQRTDNRELVLHDNAEWIGTRVTVREFVNDTLLLVLYFFTRCNLNTEILFRFRSRDTYP